MSILVIGEKPSVSRELAKVLGANTKKNGWLEGNGYVVSWCLVIWSDCSFQMSILKIGRQNGALHSFP